MVKSIRTSGKRINGERIANVIEDCVSAIKVAGGLNFIAN